MRRLFLRGLGRPAVAAAVTAGDPGDLGFGGIGIEIRNREAEPAVLTAKRDRHLSSLLWPNYNYATCSRFAVRGITNQRVTLITFLLAAHISGTPQEVQRCSGNEA